MSEINKNRKTETRCAFGTCKRLLSEKTLKEFFLGNEGGY